MPALEFESVPSGVTVVFRGVPASLPAPVAGSGTITVSWSAMWSHPSRG